MKIKTICLFMSLLVVASFSGCQGQNNFGENRAATVENENGEQPKSNEETTEQSEEQNENKENTENDKEENEADNTETGDAPEFLAVDVTDTVLYKSDSEKSIYNYIEVQYSKISLDEECAKKYPDLQKTLNEINLKKEKDKSDKLNELNDKYLEYESFENVDDIVRYKDSHASKVLRADENVLSIISNDYSFEGGAHGYYEVFGEAFDVETGAELSLLDVITDKEKFTLELKDRLLEKYQDSGFLVDLDEYFSNLSFEGENELSWSIDYSGLTIYFEPYEIASYAEGLLTVRFSFAENSELINDKYENVPKDYITPVTTWTESYADINADGEEEPILLVATAPDVDNGYDNWEWRVGDKQITGVTEAYDNESYLVKKDDKYYAYMFNSVENDYHMLVIFDIATGKSFGDDFGFGNYHIHGKDNDYDEEFFRSTVEAFINPDSVNLDSRLDVLGTYTGTKNYYISEEGTPVSEEDFYFVPNMQFMISPVHDVNCKIVDKEGNIIEENAVLPKDSMLRIVRTDGEKTADLQAGDYNIVDEDAGTEEYPYWRTEDPVDLDKGTIYRIEYEIEDYETLLEGESVFDVFKGIMFAG